MIDIAALTGGVDIDSLSERKKRELIKLIEAIKDKERHNMIASLYPDTGPLRRELYSKHMEFYAAGATYIERLLMAGNRTGKTIAGGYETALHLTGFYPEWWEGKRFTKPTKVWAAGYSSETTRDIVQFTMLGDIASIGSGLIPRDLILDRKAKAGGVPGAVDTVVVRHASGGESYLGFKCYSQGRKSFEGTAQNAVWFDEEADLTVYNEAMMRVATTHGIVYTTFTPLQGLSDMVMSFMPQNYQLGESG